jgi:TolB-like protein
MFKDKIRNLPFPAVEIQRQLALMLAHPDFLATPQQVDLLRYVVRQTMDGKADKIKAYTVATEVFGRRSDFDQNVDPIVSIQASRLRRALQHYYETAGKNDRIRIDIPTGTYIPVFEKCHSAQVMIDQSNGGFSAHEGGRSWPSVFVRPLRNFSDAPELDAWNLTLATELANELNRYPDIRVMTIGADQLKTSPGKHRGRFVLDGNVRSDGTYVKVILHLSDTQTNRQIWSDAFRSSIDAARSIVFQEQIARVVAVKIAGRRGWIAQTLDREARRGTPQHSQIYEAALRYYEYELTWNPEVLDRVLSAMERAIAIDPDCGQAWSMRARLFAQVHAFDIPGFKRPLEQAFTFAQNGLRLLPGDQRAHVIMAFVHLLRNDLKSGRAEVDRALHLDAETLFVLDGIGYLMTLMGDWERGPALIEQVLNLNPFCSNDVHSALWVNWLRQKAYDRACQETMKLNRPALFWDHLARAATLGLCGKIEEGRRSAAELLIRQPDFPQRGRMLIEHFIKFDDIAARVFQGLAAVGITVD